MANPSRTGLSGTYTLTLSASSGCRLELPEDLRTRTYTANIVQADGSLMLTVQYQSPMSCGQPNRFPGWFGGTNEVIFQVGFEEWWLESEGQFHASGRITSTISDGGLSGFLDGDMCAWVRKEDGRGSGTSRARLRTTAWCFRGDSCRSCVSLDGSHWRHRAITRALEISAESKSEESADAGRRHRQGSRGEDPEAVPMMRAVERVRRSTVSPVAPLVAIEGFAFARPLTPISIADFLRAPIDSPPSVHAPRTTLAMPSQPTNGFT